MTRDPADFVRRETRLISPALLPELKLHLADEALPLWQATEAELDAQGLAPPFWAFAWPGGQALARLILDQPERVRGKRIVDFGAGCGVAGIAAMKAGAAAVLAIDIDPFAQACLDLNAWVNGVSLTISGQDPLDGQVDADLLMIGDMCYERPLAIRVESWAKCAARAGVEVWLADPGRAYRPETGLTEIARYRVPTSLDLEDRLERETIVCRVSAANSG